MIYKILWILIFPFSLAVTLFCWITNPIVCFFPSRQPNGRDKLWGIFNLWSTFDANVDEYFYGGYGGYPPNTQTQANYDNSKSIRYQYRLLWLRRNTAYGWSYFFFSIKRGGGFQFKKRVPIPFWFFGYTINDMNIGWRDHPSAAKLDYAGRLLGLRKS